MTTRFRFQGVLDLRHRREQEAERAFALAVKEHAHAEQEQSRLDALIAAAKGRAAQDRASRSRSAPGNAGDAQARERLRQRLNAEIERAVQNARSHETTKLADALASKNQALTHHREARRDREAMEKLKARQEQDERRLAQRREEDAASDLALGVRHAKQRKS
jgi:hypothetical protein